MRKYPLLVYSLKHDVCVKEFAAGRIKMTVSDKIHPEFIANFHKILQETTGLNWDIETQSGVLGETLADKENQALEREQRDVMAYPLVRAIMAEFKGAKIESLIRRVQNAESSVVELGSDNNNDLIFDEENE